MSFAHKYYMQLLGENFKPKKQKNTFKNQPQMPVVTGIDAKSEILHGPYFRVKIKNNAAYCTMCGNKISGL